MKCVKCDGELGKVKMGDVEADQCSECSGLWFDFGEMKKVLAQEKVVQWHDVLKNNAGDDQKEGICPCCGGDGRLVPVINLKHDIHIDTCTVCYGQWLDGGELEELRRKGLFDSVGDFFKNLVG